MVNDFIQDGIEKYESRKQEIKNKYEAEIAKELDARYKSALEKVYGTSLTEEEREQKMEDIYNKYYTKTIQDAANSKKQEIAGKTYKSVEIDRNKLIGGLLMAALILLTSALHRDIVNNELLSKYSEMRSDMTSDFTPSERDQLDPITKEDIPELRKAIEEYDGPYTYTFGGDRTDGTHNDYYVFEKDSLIQVSDQQLDPIERLVKKEVKEITKDRVPNLELKEAGSVGIKEGFGEPIGSGRRR